LAVNFGIDDHGMDVLMYGATSGAYILWDESANQLVGVGGAQISLNDSVELLLGTGASNAGDFNIYSDGTSLFVKEISAAGKSLLLGQSGKGLAVTFYGDDAGYDLQWVQASNMLEFQDNAVLAFGTESDITATWNASDLLIEWATQDTGAIKFGATDAGDVNFYANTPASYASFDSGAAELILEGYDLGLQDDDILQFGDANDITITWDQSKLVIEGATADTAISIGKATNLDLVIYGDTSTDAVTFDTGSEDININGFDVSVNDDDLVKFGDTDDITMTWDGSASNFLIDGATANVSIDIGATSNLDVIIYGDSTNDTVAFDTSAELCTFNGFDLTLQDADILSFGDAGTTDCYITWDTTRLQVVPSSNVFIGDKTNYVSISSAGAMTQTGTAAFVANSAAANMGGLQIPYHATSSPSGAGGTGAIWFEVDASKLWVNIGGTNWIGTVLS